MPIGLSIILVFIGLFFTWAGRNRYEKRDCTGLPTAMATVSYNNTFGDRDRFREYHTLQTFKLPTGEDAVVFDAMQNAVSFFKWPKRFKNPMEGEHEIYYWPYMVPNPDKILGFPNILKKEGEGDWAYPDYWSDGVQIKYESRFVDESLYDAFRYKGMLHRIGYYSMAIFFFMAAIVPHFIW